DSGEVVNRVIQRGDTITIQYGRLGVERTIHMNISEHPDGIEPSRTGHSLGRWDGDTLIVDTTGFEAGLFNSRTPHSDQLHVRSDSGEVVNRVIQRGDTITIRYGRLGVERTIHLNINEHPDGIEPSRTGHSRGRWDGDTLIVDTTGFEAGLFNSRTPHSDQLHV